jgi:hypothetical protein
MKVHLLNKATNGLEASEDVRYMTLQNKKGASVEAPSLKPWFGC